jgi:superfamily II DNA or RNA helicase/HKD family nuclease
MSNVNLRAGLETGFVDKANYSDPSLWPSLLTNDPDSGKKVLSSLISELRNCQEYWIFVSFITTSGVASLLNTLEELEHKNVKGCILVSTYLNFSQPEAIKRIKRFKNIDIRVSSSNAFHSKGFLFRKNNLYRLIIGSSNLTQSALSTNKEWNLKVVATSESEIIRQTLLEFNNEFKNGIITDDSFISAYTKQWLFQREIGRINQEIDSIESKIGIRQITPNKMQLVALKNLSEIRDNGQTKALIISATGTGKTFLSAFDVKQFNPKRLLFIVHRFNIAESAMKSFKKIMPMRTAGLYSGMERNDQADFIFSTIQTISKKEHLNKFNPDHFDYIIVDETHRVAGETYNSALEYFKPKFLLGMTATPERSDSQDIYRHFDYNIACDIRLNQALKEEMLCPFHYYGVTDLFINDQPISDVTKIRQLEREELAKRIIEKSEYYNSDTGKIKCLVFCSKIETATALASEFNKFGKPSIALIGSSSDEARSNAITEIQKDSDETIQYIFTVDIFNEGVDIPKINQIILLRPTESAIIFIQQLGRGLRVSENKEYLTVIDFIGNYGKNYLLPIALYGDQSYNKDNLRRLLTGGSSYIPGASTVNFDRIAMDKIFESINNNNFSALIELKKSYFDLKFRLGKKPLMMDFMESDLRDPVGFVESKKSYFNFVQYVDNDCQYEINQNGVFLLEKFATLINNGVRPHESLLLKTLIENGSCSLPSFCEMVMEKFLIKLEKSDIHQILNVLNLDFFKLQSERIIGFENDLFSFTDFFKEQLLSKDFLVFLTDNINYSLSKFEQAFNRSEYVSGFLRHEKYSRRDVCRILNWENDFSSTIYGYRTRNKVTPCFVTYNKSDELEGDINYNDHFINQEVFAWESRSNRKIDSDEIKNVINSERILLFIKKADSEGVDFYFIGDVEIVPGSIEQGKMPKTDAPVVHFQFKIDKPVQENLYNYLIH